MKPTFKLQPLVEILRRPGWPAALVGVVAPSIALAGPSGGVVVGGDGVATIGTNGATTTINQAASNAVINWQNFSVGASEYVVFNQPSARSEERRVGKACVRACRSGGSPSHKKKNKENKNDKNNNT